MTVTEAMLVIKSLDKNAHVFLSEYTGKWLVEAGLEIGNGVILRGASRHMDSPDDAVYAYLAVLKGVTYPEYIATQRQPRREYRWNGAAFADVTRPEVLATQGLS